MLCFQFIMVPKSSDVCVRSITEPRGPAAMRSREHRERGRGPAA